MYSVHGIPRAGDIGEEEREITVWPVEEPAPATVPAPAAPVEDPELVPA